MDQSFASSVAVLDRRFTIRVAVYRLNDFGSFILLLSSQWGTLIGAPRAGGVIERERRTGFLANYHPALPSYVREVSDLPRALRLLVGATPHYRPNTQPLLNTWQQFTSLCKTLNSSETTFGASGIVKT